YEMLTGRPVFAHPNAMMIMMMHVRDPIVPIRDLVPEVPPAVAIAVERCLAKSPTDRPSSAGDLLRQFLEAQGPASEAPVTMAASVLVPQMPAPAPAPAKIEAPPVPAPVAAAAGPKAAATLAVPFAAPIEPARPKPPAVPAAGQAPAGPADDGAMT